MEKKTRKDMFGERLGKLIEVIGNIETVVFFEETRRIVLNPIQRKQAHV